MGCEKCKSRDYLYEVMIGDGDTKIWVCAECLEELKQEILNWLMEE